MTATSPTPTMTQNPTLTNLAQHLGARAELAAPLAQLTTLKVGGAADLLFTAESGEDMVRGIRAAIELGVPWTLLGDGSNLLISDLGIEGLVIHNCALGLQRVGNGFVAESGLLLSALVQASRDEGLTGLEFAAGIYGTVGGAVFGNAGAYGRAMVDVVESSRVLLPDGTQKTISNAEHGFAYRTSQVKMKQWLVLESTFKLEEGNQTAIGAEIDRILAVRATKLPSDLPSAGSFFKNIEDPTAEHGKIPAGKLLEEVGSKSMRVGDAAVFEKHANVIVNLGKATAEDILRLAELMRRAVKERFGITLEPEVRFLGRPMTLVEFD